MNKIFKVLYVESLLLIDVSKVQLVVCYQCYVLIVWGTTRLYVIAH